MRKPIVRTVSHVAGMPVDTDLIPPYDGAMAMTVRLPAELDQALEAIAESEHTSKHALVLQSVELLVARRARRASVDAAVDFVLSHDAELLRRLEDA
jgi:hypothetical protein